MGTTGRVIEKLFVHIIRDDNKITMLDNLSDLAHLTFAIGRASGVRRAVENQCLTLWTNDCLQLRSSDFESGLFGGRQEFRLTTSKNDHVGIAHPVRCGDKHLIPFAEQRMESIEEGMFPATVSCDFLQGVSQPIVSLQ